jgi:hypothetical protein
MKIMTNALIDIEKIVLETIKSQQTKSQHVPLDIVLKNGNIHLKGFRIYEYDEKRQTIKGMTMQEEYSFLREHRQPVFAIFHLNEIYEMDSSDCNYFFLTQPININSASV